MAAENIIITPIQTTEQGTENLTEQATTKNAETTEEEKSACGKLLRQERFSGSCSRTFYVSDAIEDTDIRASFKDGILTIELPTEKKKEEETKKFIDIL